MREISNIHAFEDDDFLHACAAGSAVVAAVCLCLLLALFWLLPAAGCALPGIPSGMEWAAIVSRPMLSVVAWLAVVAAGTLAALAAHEGVHAIFFKMFAPRGARVTFGINWKTAMAYACADGIVYERRRYLAVSLAPTVAVTAALMLLGVVSGFPFTCLLVASLHLTGCVGDWCYSWRIARDPAILWCEDTSWGVRFLGKGDDAL